MSSTFWSGYPTQPAQNTLDQVIRFIISPTPYLGVWQQGNSYNIGDVLIYGSSFYQATATVINAQITPPVDTLSYILYNPLDQADIYTALAAANGSSLIGFTQAGLGAALSTVQNELRYIVRPEQFGAVADGVTDDLIPIQEALTQSAATGYPLVFSGKAYALSGGITFNLNACSYLGNGSLLDFASAPDGTVCTTVIGGALNNTDAHELNGFKFRGRSRSGTQVGSYHNSASSGGAALQMIRNCTWSLFGTGIKVQNNAFNIHYFGCHARGNGVCVDVIGSGSSDFQENISFFGGTIFNSEILVRATETNLNFFGTSLDYPTVKHFEIGNACNVAVHGGHIEGGADGDYWFDVDGTDASLSIYGGEIAIAVTATKTNFPLGYSNTTSASGIHFINTEFTGFNNTQYQFPYIVEGWGTCTVPRYINGGSGTVGDQLGAITHTRLNVLADGGFEQTTLRDWFVENTGAVATATTAPRTGSRSMVITPTAGQAGAAEFRAACSPGDWGIFVGYLNTATWGADSIYVRTGYLDKFGAEVGTAFEQEIVAASRPTSYSRYAIRPFNAAPPGACLYYMRLTKRGAAFTGSDGNGTLFLDDAAVQIFGSGKQQFVEKYYFSRTAVTGNTTFRVPNNYAVEGIKIRNTTANAVTGGIRIGTVGGGTQVATSITVGANADLFIPASALLLSFYNTTANQTLFFEAVSAWNSASLDVNVVCNRVG